MKIKITHTGGWWDNATGKIYEVESLYGTWIILKPHPDIYNRQICPAYCEIVESLPEPPQLLKQETIDEWAEDLAKVMSQISD